MSRQPWHGVLTATALPFKPDLSVDFEQSWLWAEFGDQRATVSQAFDGSDLFGVGRAFEVED